MSGSTCIPAFPTPEMVTEANGSYNLKRLGASSRKHCFGPECSKDDGLYLGSYSSNATSIHS